MSPRTINFHRYLGLPLFLSVALGASPSAATDAPAPVAKERSALPVPPTFKVAPSEFESPKELALKRGVVLKVSQQGWADVQFTSKLPIGQRGAVLNVENVHVSRGRVDGIVPNNGTAGLLLLGPGGVQAVTAGGRISMIVGHDRVTVATFGGDALVGRSGALKPLPANTVRTFELQVARFTDRPILPAPIAKAPGLGLSLGGEAPVVIKLDNPASAASYCGFLFDAQGAAVTQTCGQTDPNHIVLQAPSAGTYWASVAAVDVDGLAGTPSQPVSVQILGAAPGSYDIENGTVFLGLGEQLKLVGYEGLVMRYGASPEYYPAASAVKPLEQKPTVVEFRNPREPNGSVVLNLSPRVLKSQIDIGPVRSTWPQDDIKVTVKMWDGQGRPLDALAEHRIVTKVGLTTVDVPFTRDGTATVGVVPTQPGPGPWVVRVSVLDANGHEVKRNFLEVATEPASPPTVSASTALPGKPGATVARR